MQKQLKVSHDQSLRTTGTHIIAMWVRSWHTRVLMYAWTTWQGATQDRLEQRAARCDALAYFQRTVDARSRSYVARAFNWWCIVAANRRACAAEHLVLQHKSAILQRTMLRWRATFLWSTWNHWVAVVRRAHGQMEQCNGTCSP